MMRRIPWRDLLALDLAVGLAAGALSGWAATQNAVASSLQFIAIACVGVSVAVLGIVLTVMTLLAAFLSDEYLVVLEGAGQSIDQVLTPYRIVATVSATSFVISLVAAVFGPTLAPGTWPPVALMSVCVFTATWATTGTVQLIGITTFHARNRVSVLKLLTDAKRARAERIEKRRAS